MRSQQIGVVLTARFPQAGPLVPRIAVTPTKLAESPLHFGAFHDLERLARTHLFLLCPNNSGSTFLQTALATSGRTWNLAREGQHVLGYSGPEPTDAGLGFIWASHPDWVARFRDPASHDWAKTRRAWYFQSTSRSPEASVFTTKAPPFLLVPHLLVSAFPRTRFLVMVRNPYAAAEGILRRRTRMGGHDADELRRIVGAHLVACFEAQQRNLESFSPVSAFFTYETMCEEPERVEARIRTLVPELDDLRIRRRLPVKGLYDEGLRDMNDDQITRLTPRDVRLLNEVFGPREALFGAFGYALI